MALTAELAQQIVSFVKQEPKTIQEVSLAIGKSWVTTEKYVSLLSTTSGELKMKTFRKGSRGALKLVYWTGHQTLQSDKAKELLFESILAGKRKPDFDVVDIFQFVPKNKRTASVIIPGTTKGSNHFDILSKATSQILFFAGNLSFLTEKQSGKKILKLFESLLEQGVVIQILSRVNVGTLRNIEALKSLLAQYPEQLSIRHAYQPLRGSIIDGELVRLYGEEQKVQNKQGELRDDVMVAFDIDDDVWVKWLEQLFWHYWKQSIDYKERIIVLDTIKDLTW